MSVYKEKLVSYLKKDSNFYAIMTVFFDGYDHSGKCGKEGYVFYSSIYKRIESNCNWKENIYKSISDEKLQHYFTKIFWDNQLFSIIFAYANNLTDIQIRNIANLKQYKRAFSILNDYLYEGIEHFVVIDNVEVKAVKDGTNIKVPSLDLSLEILEN